MGRLTHILDAKGDVLITLRNAEGRWYPAPTVKTNGTPSTDTPKVATPDAKTATMADDLLADPTFLCSSKLLIKASPIFRMSLEGSMAQPRATSDGLKMLEAEKFDEMAFWQVLQAIHLDSTIPEAMQPPKKTLQWQNGTYVTRTSPVTSPLWETNLWRLAKAAMVIEYYHCLDAVQEVAQIWTKEIGVLPSIGMSERDVEAWLFVAWALRDPGMFVQSTSWAVSKLKKPLITVDYPVPEGVVGKCHPLFFPNLELVGNLMADKKQVRSTNDGRS